MRCEGPDPEAPAASSTNSCIRGAQLIVPSSSSSGQRSLGAAHSSRCRLVVEVQPRLCAAQQATRFAGARIEDIREIVGKAAIHLAVALELGCGCSAA